MRYNKLMKVKVYLLKWNYFEKNYLKYIITIKLILRYLSLQYNINLPRFITTLNLKYYFEYRSFQQCKNQNQSLNVKIYKDYYLKEQKLHYLIPHLLNQSRLFLVMMELKNILNNLLKYLAHLNLNQKNLSLKKLTRYYFMLLNINLVKLHFNKLMLKLELNYQYKMALQLTMLNRF